VVSSGAHLTLLFEPDSSETVTTKVIATQTADERTTRIKQPVI
jgi:hypothetical protein